jgi:hypothetical protein
MDVITFRIRCIKGRLEAKDTDVDGVLLIKTTSHQKYVVTNEFYFND